MEGAFLTVFVTSMVWGWEGSGSKAISWGLGLTDNMNQHMGTDLSSQVVPHRSLRLLITV